MLIGGEWRQINAVIWSFLFPGHPSLPQSSLEAWGSTVSGSGQSPAARLILVHIQLQISPLVTVKLFVWRRRTSLHLRALWNVALIDRSVVFIRQEDCYGF